MRRKIKNLRKNNPSLLTYLSTQDPNGSVDKSLGKGFRGSRLKMNYNLQNSFITSFENHVNRSSLPYLKESLTVKKIEFSPPRRFEMPIILQPKQSKQLVLETIYSYKQINKTRTESLPNSSHRQKVRQNSEKKTISLQPSPKIISSKKEASFTLKPQIVPSQKLYKPLPKMNLREAIRVSDWTTKAKPELDKMWRKILNRSNGIEMPSQPAYQYKYYIGKGNNSRLVRRLMAARSWWVDCSNIEEAHFVWTQWKDKKVLASFECGKTIKLEKQETIQVPSICPINVKVDKKQYRSVDIEDLGFQYIRNSASYTNLETVSLDPGAMKMHNKIEFNQHLTNKKGLYQSLKNYCLALDMDLLDFVPLTFHVQSGEADSEFIKFSEAFNSIEQDKKKTKSQNIWIVKPGENSNRGQGITVSSSLDQIKSIINDTSTKLNERRTYIVQKYLEKPFLVHKRKFDFRCYGLITSLNGVLQGYFYSDGYLRTTSCEYNIKDVSNNFIHLTNDAIQKHSEEYGKYEDGNKLSYRDFQRYLDYHCSDKKINFINDILPKIKNLARDSIQAAYLKLDPNRRLHCMEILGYDFMIDSHCKPWLIEVNTNPCLELSSNYLSILIPAMVENALRIAVDPMFPPPSGKHNFDSFFENKFELVFHQETDGRALLEKLGDNKNLLQEEELLSDKEELFSEDDELE
jgi:Tubulin-tyrosine ligase family